MKYRQVWKKKIGSEPCSVGVEKWDWIDGTEVSHLTPLQFQLGFGNTFYFHTPKKMFISSCNLHIHWSVLKKGKPIIMWCSKPATWTRDSLSDPSFFLSFSHCAICCWTLTEYHMNIRDAMCELCGKSYPNDRALRKHLKTHAIQREHVCPDCGKDFLTSTKLNEHRRVHTGAKPFQVCSPLKQELILARSWSETLTRKFFLLTTCLFDVEPSNCQKPKAQCKSSMCVFEFLLWDAKKIVRLNCAMNEHTGDFAVQSLRLPGW